MKTVGVQWLGELLAEQDAHILAGHGPGQAGHQPTEGKRVIGRFAEQPSRSRRRQPLLHHDVIQQVFLAGTAQSRQARRVPHHLADGGLLLAVGRELRPVLRDRRLVIDQPPIGEPVDHGGGHALGGREHHRGRVR